MPPISRALISKSPSLHLAQLLMELEVVVGDTEGLAVGEAERLNVEGLVVVGLAEVGLAEVGLAEV